jgi:hypothetical protein
LKIDDGDIAEKVVSARTENKTDTHYNPCAEHWQLAKEPADYFFSSAKYYETGVKERL